FVATMIYWMNRVARGLKRQIEQRVESFAQQTAVAAGLGIATFVFLMVLREGVELVLILRAVEISSQGVAVWIGTALGLGLALAVGVFFFKGTLRIPLARFFAATTVILWIVVFQLLLTGTHELSEATWIPSSKTEMALVGPIVRNDIFFFVLILGAAAVVVLREWLALRHAGAAADAHAADRRRAEWEHRQQRRWAISAAVACVAVVVMLAADFIYSTASAAAPDAKVVVAEDNRLQIPLSEVNDSNLHFYSVDVAGAVVRFLVIRKPNGSFGTALDACQICGPKGYYQNGANVICRNCAAAIYVPSIGEDGGCNPIGFASRVEGDRLLIDVSALAEALGQKKN
ncbi:MAG TPA: Fe-S-containing protein, partial [Candidatus Acidoferrales bacterium]|nr:Fe-S-containing protein [Candidatus Acidoferrales bacterium]